MTAAASRTSAETDEQDATGGRVVEIDAAIRAALSAAREPRRGEAPEQDWRGTLDLVHRASDLLRAAEERVRDLEDGNREIAERATRETEMLEARIAQAQARADAAEQRRRDAEEWLRRIHGAIAEHFRA